jgi:NADH-quinone oxidoreductase subunit L
MMTILLNLCVGIPVLGLLVNVLLPSKNETLIARTSSITVGLHFVVFTTLFFTWLLSGFPQIDLKELVLFKTHDYEFFIDFTFDKITATYAFIGCVLTFMITVYSHAYLHREPGYKRFYNSVLFFYFGYTIVIFAGNLETLFTGWEILGISSFLLIAFYRDRYLPVKNAVKVFSIYRIGDVGLLLAMWMSHHLWLENITFEKLSNYELVHHQLQTHSFVGVAISLMILLSAAAKSAQLPFSSWLPRAMEGPTPSTAIFYGSLSVHIGVFLLLRTYHFWEQQLSVRILIGLLGLSTSIVASSIARVQSSVKSQIAYSSIAQIGLIFIEVALGWVDVALIHFAGNAFLRTYQLLVSPSVVTYLIREQFYNFVPRPHTFEDSLPKKLEYSLYILSVKEFNLDSIMYRYLWNPLKWLGKQLYFMTLNRVIVFGGLMLALAGVGVYADDLLPASTHEYLPAFFACIGLLFVLKSFTERKHVRVSWVLIIMSHFWISLATSFNENFDFNEIIIYLSGIVLAGIGGFICLFILKSLERNIDLDRFHGHAHIYKGLAFLFLICCLGVVGFPITPTFVGEDLIFSHIHEDQFVLASLIALTFILDGLAVIRIYARVFLGPHVKSVYETAYRSS